MSIELLGQPKNLGGKNKMCSSPTSATILLGSICQFGVPGRGEESGLASARSHYRESKTSGLCKGVQLWKNKIAELTSFKHIAGFLQRHVLKSKIAQERGKISKPKTSEK